MSNISKYDAYFREQLNITDILTVESIEQELGEILPDSIIHPLLKSRLVITHTYYNESLTEDELFPFIIEVDEKIVAIGCMQQYLQYIYYLNYMELLNNNSIIREEYGIYSEYMD
ncbi:MAG TPA: SAUGI family uracil-DNA glycosylase inhibitor [Jeotgalicoccus sp.]|nr:SAUGI family uracil-DNA glycosylase inhibitor [Jeotgalicoccus sp.]